MRAAIVLALALLALGASGCSLLFAPSSYGDQRDGGRVGPDADASRDAASPDAFALEAGTDAGEHDAAPSDAAMDDANVDAAMGIRQHWPDCPEAAVDARDANGRSAEPSVELRAALGLASGAGFGVVSDLPLAGMPTDLALVEMTSDALGILFVIAAPDAPGPPVIQTVSRDSFALASVPVTGFPAGDTILDLSAVRSTTGPLLALLTENGATRTVRTCPLSPSGCALTMEAVDILYAPNSIAMLDRTAGPVPVIAGVSASDGSGVFVSRPDDFFSTATPGGTLAMHADSRASASGGAVALIGCEAASSAGEWLAVSLDGAGSVQTSALLQADAATLMLTGTDSYVFLGARRATGGMMEVSRRTVACAPGAACALSGTTEIDLVSGVEPIVMDGEYDAATQVGFVVMGMGYDDAEGTDVRLYVASPLDLVPITTSDTYVTLGTGRGGPRGTLSSTAMTTYFGSSETDVFEVTVAATGGSEAVYLSAARFCHLGAP